MSDTTRPGMRAIGFGDTPFARAAEQLYYYRNECKNADTIDRIEPNGIGESDPESARSPTPLTDFAMPNQTGEQAKVEGKADESPSAPTQQEQNSAAKDKLEDDEQEALMAFGIAAHCTAEA